jgi:tetratricopeptide (TPR) repeat protein
MTDRRGLRFFLMICLCFAGAAAAFPQSRDAALDELRNQFAVNYMQPEAHFALAKYYLDKGDKVQAFYILEYARRYRFSEKDFDVAYEAFFGNNMAEPTDAAKDAFEIGARLVREQKYDEAEQYLLKAANLGAKSFFINAWVGRYYYKTRPNTAKALPFYFNAYFLYPHAYETEYVESRIRNITLSDANALYSMLRGGGRSPAEISRDRNPLIVGRALEDMEKEWKPEYLKVMLECMSSDSSLVRWFAFSMLNKNAGPLLDETLAALLADKDLRKRGLAAYGILGRGKEKGIEILKKMLADPAELIRFDALSALALGGGPVGMKMVREHLRVEKDPRLKEYISKALESKKTTTN